MAAYTSSILVWGSYKIIMKNLTEKAEAQIIKQLESAGVIYINFWSTDCDGCSSAGNTSFTSMESLLAWIDASFENAEGSWGWDLTDEKNLVSHDPVGHWGM